MCCTKLIYFCWMCVCILRREWRYSIEKKKKNLWKLSKIRGKLDVITLAKTKLGLRFELAYWQDNFIISPQELFFWLLLIVWRIEMDCRKTIWKWQKWNNIRNERCFASHSSINLVLLLFRAFGYEIFYFIYHNKYCSI